MYIGIGIGIVLLIIIIWIISTNNKFTRLHNKVKEASSGIDVALSKRYNALTNLIEVVKGYSKHEEEVFTKVIELRQNMNTKEQIKANEDINDSFTKVYAICENYPELKASSNYLNLQKAIIDTEEHLMAARRLYNSNVSLYNTALEVFPSNIIAKINKLQSEELFKASNEEKENPLIK